MITLPSNLLSQLSIDLNPSETSREFLNEQLQNIKIIVKTIGFEPLLIIQKNIKNQFKKEFFLSEEYSAEQLNSWTQEIKNWEIIVQLTCSIFNNIISNFKKPCEHLEQSEFFNEKMTSIDNIMNEIDEDLKKMREKIDSLIAINSYFKQLANNQDNSIRNFAENDKKDSVHESTFHPQEPIFDLEI